MTRNESAPATTTGAGTQARPAPMSDCDYTATSAQRQPAWLAWKLQADMCWLSVCRLLTSLGYGEPVPSSWAVDARECCDFVTPDGTRWAWRSRGARYLGFHDCTLRLSRPSGAATEAQKLGLTDRLLFSWASGCKLVAWLILRTDRVAPLLSQSWPAHDMGDATFVAVPWEVLYQAGAVIDCSAGVRAVIGRGV